MRMAALALSASSAYPETVLTTATCPGPFVGRVSLQMAEARPSPPLLAAPPPRPYTLFDEADEESDTADGISLAVDNVSRDSFAIVEAPRKSLHTTWDVPPSHALGGPVAHRVLRDALALQLARRGFDGLRQSALWLVTELTSDFLRALGSQLSREGQVPPAASPAAITRRIQRHANMLSPAEWRQAQLSFQRVAEPNVPSGHGSGHRLPGQALVTPASVTPLYTAIRGAWNYKLTPAGRQAHQSAGAAEVPSASSAPLAPGVTGRELSESLRLSKKQRQMAETWLQASVGSSSTAPVLLPGPAFPPEPAAGAKGAGGAGTGSLGQGAAAGRGRGRGRGGRS